MARATRSTAALQHEKDRLSDPSSLVRARQSTKKRKRISLADNDDQPPLKQRHAENAVKEEQNLDDDEKLSSRRLHDLDLAADVPIDPSDAQKILDILALVDTQGLLDRVFPLPSSDLSEPSTSKSQAGSFSLRTLLRESSQHPLRALRSAVLNLFPISFNPRSQTSSPAIQQLRFCTLARSLLDQASFHSVPLPLDLDTILSDGPEPSTYTDTKPTPDPSSPEKAFLGHSNRRYALMQRLPSGTWWTSLSSDLVSSDGKTIKDVPLANAEMVAILPCPSLTSSGTPASDSTKPSSTTLGSYSTKKPPGNKQNLPGPRRVSCGSFLDYGPYASFAPSFEQDGGEVGRRSLGEVYWDWEERKQRWKQEAISDADTDVCMDDEPVSEIADEAAPNGVVTSHESWMLEDDGTLDGLFSKDQIRVLKEALGNPELQVAVQELLERNARALKRLGELQNRRLMQPGAFVPVQQGSEEWDTAHGILDSLVLLASLRPRATNIDNETPVSEPSPLVPSAAALRQLHRTLPTAAAPGWFGTLPHARSSALRDDATLYIKSTATTLPSNPPAISTPTPAAHPSAAVAAAAATGTPAQPHPAYSYNYVGPYHRTGYQFKAPQTYYPGAYVAGTTGQTPNAAQYYAAGGQYAMQPSQQQYAYSWYQYTPQSQANASTSAAVNTAQSGAGTTVLPTTYAGFFSNAAQGTQRAVANTVMTSAGKTSGGSAGYVSSPVGVGVRPTSAAGQGQSGQVGQMQPGYTPAAGYQPGYYGAYQTTTAGATPATATPAPAQS